MILCQNVEQHAVKMMVELNRMKEDKDHCDFAIEVGNDVYYAHKNILSAGSDYFRAMLKHDTKESRESRVVFKDVDSECVKICIDSIYSSEIEFPDGKMIELLHVAIMMQLEGIKHTISDILVNTVTIDNFFSTRNVGDIYGLDVVSSECRIFLQENIMEIANQAGFVSVEKNDLISVLKSTKAKLWEEEKLELSLKWTETCEKKKEYLYECLEFVDFDEISPTFLQHLLENNPTIRNDSKLNKLISGHLQEASVELVKTTELIILFDEETDCIRSFDPVSEKITKFHNAGFRRFNCFTAIFLDLHVYILCKGKSVYRLNVQRTNSKWQNMEDMICEHGTDPCSVSLCGSIFVIGGSEIGEYRIESTDVERYDPSVNRWFQLPNKPTPICHASLVSLDDSVYCIGGFRDRVQVSSFCRFNPSSTEWVDLEPMRYPVFGCGTVAVDQMIYVTGGWSGNEMINDVECYDVTSAQWTSLSSTNLCHSFNTAYLIGNWIIVVDRLGDSDCIEKYNLLNKKWYSIKKEARRSFELCGSAMVKV